MLTITVGASELFDEEKSEFFSADDGMVLQFEHSLVSLSKWEEIWERPFLRGDEPSPEEDASYIECMLLTPNVPPEILRNLSADNREVIREYINRKMTGTTFPNYRPPSGPKEILSAELIYYWMFSAGIPKECETWHLNKLFTLIQVYSAKNTKPKPLNRDEAMRQRREENERRRKELGTSG